MVRLFEHHHGWFVQEQSIRENAMKDMAEHEKINNQIDCILQLHQVNDFPDIPDVGNSSKKHWKAKEKLDPVTHMDQFVSDKRNEPSFCGCQFQKEISTMSETLVNMHCCSCVNANEFLHPDHKDTAQNIFQQKWLAWRVDPWMENCEKKLHSESLVDSVLSVTEEVPFPPPKN